MSCPDSKSVADSLRFSSEDASPLEPFLVEIRRIGGDKPCEVHAEPQWTCAFCLWDAMTRSHADPSLLKAVRTILRGFEEGVFVRSIDNDHDSAWAIRLFPFIHALAVAREHVGPECLSVATAINRADGK